MQKFAKKLSILMVALFTVFTVLSYVPAKAAVVVPKVGYVEKPKLEYTVGDRVQFNLNAPNYGGRVQYRVVLWQDETKSYRDLWTTSDRYYTNWMPYGNETFTLGWPIFEPGHYRITIYAKRAGVANNLTALKGMNSDSYMESEPFVVKAKVDSAALLLDAYDKVSKYELASFANLDEIAKVEALKQPAVDAVAKLTDKDAEKKSEFEARIEKRANEISAKKLQLQRFQTVSVKAINATQLLVTFNNEVDKTEAELTSNYLIGGVSPIAAVLQADKKSTLLTMLQPLAGTNLYTVKEIKSASDITVKTNVFTYVEAYSDTKAPYVVGVEYPTYKTAKVNFSEPMQTIGAVVLVQDGKDITSLAYGNDFVAGSTSYTFNLSSDLIVLDKPIALTIVGAQDRAGLVETAKANLINPNPTSVSITKVKTDTTKPVVTNVNPLSDARVAVSFSEALAVAPIISINGIAVAAGNVSLSNDGLTYNATFAGGAGVKTVKVSAYTDISGNAGDEYTKLVQFNADTTRPALLNSEVKVFSGKQYLVLSYTEDVNAGVGNISGTRVKDYINYTVPATAVTAKAYTKANGADVDNTKAVMIDITTFAEGQYNIILPATIVSDLASVPNSTVENAISFIKNSITVSDTTAPTVNAIPAFSADNAYMTVIFSEDMDPATALNVANYKVGGVSIFSSAIFDGNAKTVKLTVIPGTITLTGNRLVTVEGAKDKAGNVVTAYSNIVNVVENVKPYASSAVLTNSSTITVTFSENMSSIAATDFDVYVNGVKVNAGVTTTVSLVPTKTATVTIPAITDLSKNIQIVYTNSNGVDESGNTAVIGNFVQVNY